MIQVVSMVNKSRDNSGASEWPRINDSVCTTERCQVVVDVWRYLKTANEIPASCTIDGSGRTDTVIIRSADVDASSRQSITRTVGRLMPRFRR